MTWAFFIRRITFTRCRIAFAAFTRHPFTFIFLTFAIGAIVFTRLNHRHMARFFITLAHRLVRATIWLHPFGTFAFFIPRRTFTRFFIAPPAFTGHPTTFAFFIRGITLAGFGITFAACARHSGALFTHFFTLRRCGAFCSARSTTRATARSAAAS